MSRDSQERWVAERRAVRLALEDAIGETEVDHLVTMSNVEELVDDLMPVVTGLIDAAKHSAIVDYIERKEVPRVIIEDLAEHPIVAPSLAALDSIVAAYVEPGREPAYHARQQVRLSKEWVPLHTALQEAVRVRRAGR